MKKPLQEIFPQINIGEIDEAGELGGAVVSERYINVKEREVGFTLITRKPLSGSVVTRLEGELKKICGTELISIKYIVKAEPQPPKQTAEKPGFQPEQLNKIIAYCREKSPLCNGFFSGAEAILENGTFKITLSHGGSGIICANGVDKLVEEYLLRELGITAKCLIEDGETAPPPPPTPVTVAPARPAKKSKKTPDAPGAIIMGGAIKKEPAPIASASQSDGEIALEGEVFAVDIKELKNGEKSIFSFGITDGAGSIKVKRFVSSAEADELAQAVKAAGCVKVSGEIRYDRFENDIHLWPKAINASTRETRDDDAPDKRIELHLHTSMSALDGVSSVKKYIDNAASWGQEALAITDHGSLQAFPEAYLYANKTGYKGKLIYGIEAYYVNDSAPILFGESDISFDGEFVVFDIETTGLGAAAERITEIGAVRIRNGSIVEEFHTMANPEKPIPPRIVEITGINDDMVRDAPSQKQALESFAGFAGGAVLAAHNASFDMGFINAGCARYGIGFSPAYIDTLALARGLYPELKNHKLDTLAKALDAGNFNHHRAGDDARVLANIFVKMLKETGERYEISSLEDFNSKIAAGGGAPDPRRLPTYHMTILAKDKAALRNLFILVSLSNLKYFYKKPRIPKSRLLQHREGLLIGTACASGELFQAMVDGRPQEEIEKTASFYDYFEIQPAANSVFLVEDGKLKSPEEIKDINRRIFELGKKLKKPVVATGDVHFLEPEDEIYRRILLDSQNYSDADKPMPLYMKTTAEMLEEFSYLGEEAAYEAVIKNPKLIAGMCDVYSPLPPEGVLYKPQIDGAEEELERCCAERAHELYGEQLPPWVEQRLEKELSSIIKHGYAVIYIIARRLVKKSVSAGYLVGSRGSVGSSIAAYMAGITEVNGLPPHYVCRKCKNSELMQGQGFECGIDLPDKFCPVCGEKYIKDGFDIPFETFLGFEADKVPDIDLNFSGEYQSQMHRFVEELLGKDKIFRAGTVGTLQLKSAIAFVKDYAEKRGLSYSNLELERLAAGCEGIKRSTGQHPGGMMVVPRDMDIYDFTPVQHPADDADKNTITTHFEFSYLHDNILKLDMLGHDDPTMIKMLGDLTGIDAAAVPLDDPDTMRLFTSCETLGLKGEHALSKVGSIAVPEFGTRFVRGMLEDTRPTTFGELLRISGLSHGTDVWLGNAAELIKNNTADLKQVICTRDDIMLYLISKNIEKKLAFTIMEAVRKGKGLKPEWEDAMRQAKVPDWYIESCNKIKYMFPKAHAAAYVMMAYRIAWFKVHRPIEFYAAYFTVRADDFDAEKMIYGSEAVTARLSELGKQPRLNAKEKSEQTILEVCYEYYLRGYTFANVDIQRSDAAKFKVVDKTTLLAPLNSLKGLGTSAAESVAQAREKGPFDSVEELSARTKLSSTVIDLMRALGVFKNLPESSQTSLF